MQPVVPINEPAKPGQSNLIGVDFGVFLISLISGGVVLGLAIYFFTGFANSGQGWKNLTSAFLLCFGFGVLLSIPLFALAFLARRIRLGRYTRRGLWLGLALILPWLIVSGFFLAHSALPLRFGVSVFLLSFILTSWVIWRLTVGMPRLEN